MKTQLRRTLGLALICSLLLVLMACPNNTDALRQAATAAKDASSTVAAFQDAEIESFKSQVVDAEDHQAIQGMLVQVAAVGKALNAGLRAANDTPSAIRVLAVAVTQVDQLERDGVLHIKNKDLQTKWSLAMIGVKTSLNTIAVMLDKGATK